jgi:hypothetical protein
MDLSNTFKEVAEEYNKKLKGYQYDSLVYRYIRAREAMAEAECYKRNFDREVAHKQAQRDIVRFIQILDETIGEHD